MENEKSDNEEPVNKAAVLPPQARLEQCRQEIAKVCEDYGCRVAPYFKDVEPVGRLGSKIQVEATWGVILVGES